jgi:hypothetical protein
MFVNEVSVSDREIVISGPVSPRANSVPVEHTVKESTVPIFDRKWCPTTGKAEHSNHWKFQPTLNN